MAAAALRQHRQQTASAEQGALPVEAVQMVAEGGLARAAAVHVLHVGAVGQVVPSVLDEILRDGQILLLHWSPAKDPRSPCSMRLTIRSSVSPRSGFTYSRHWLSLLV